ncbi:hypothetical protein GCM10023321_65940 [Pseudonocardia eucalypti]|uniref:HTH luxR-type domain-containing protein n=1 Tax=Pseudonocardia eucalypti TaxID=648755 RepID=A0ABP9QZQ5_9PSEU
MYLPHASVDRALSLVADLTGLTDEAGLLDALLPGLADLIGCDFITYTEVVEGSPPMVRYIDHPRGTLTPEVCDGFLRHFHQHPVAAYHRITGDGRALRMSDFLTTAQFHKLALYQECYRPRPAEHILAVGLSLGGGPVGAFALNRASGEFTEADRELLDLLRGPLGRCRARLRARQGAPAGAGKLTSREAQVLEQVALGRTNAAIGRSINCSPRTVSKHLENIYKKLSVANRAAAVAHTRLGVTRPL